MRPPWPRTRRRPDHRRRRVGRGRRAAARPGRVQGRVPRAGRLARPGGLPGQQARLGAEGAQGLGDQPEHPRPRRRTTRSSRTTRRVSPLMYNARRRLDDHLRRRLAAGAAVGLPGPLARRRRRRLADRLLRAPAVLLPDRPPVRRVRPARRPGLPARHRGRADAAAADRVGRAQGRARADEARLALVAGVQLDQLDRLRRPPAVRPAQHLPVGLQRGRQGLDRPDPLAEGDRARRAAGHRRPRAPDRDQRARPRDRRDLDRPRRRRALRAGEGRRGGGERHRHAAAAAELGGDRRTPTASRTRPASSASG